MWRRYAPVVLILCVLVSVPFLEGANCGDGTNGVLDPEDETLSITFDEQLACAQDCFDDFGQVFNVLMHVLREVNDPHGYHVPMGIGVDLDTNRLQFGSDLYLEGGLQPDAHLRGTIRPPPANRGACSNPTRRPG